MPRQKTSSRLGFTLIELLVVLAVIGIFVGVFATALRPGSPTAAVEGAQAQIASLITQARGVATTRGADSYLIVHADETNRDRYLRFIGIVYDGDPDDGSPGPWVPATDGVSLPGGVYVVPPDTVDTPEGVDWESKLNSQFSNGSSIVSLQYISNTPEDYYFIRFTDRGLVPQTEPIILSVSTAAPASDGTGLEYNTPGATRGAILRPYGSFVLLNEPDAFPQ